MSHHKLREDKTCLNCGRTVDDRYCGHCGQENIETHQTFGGLVAHFMEDLTHYEGSFWKTIKYLFAKPGFLTREFLKGRRGSYLPPVRLYIFISFVAFFVPHILPEPHQAEEPLTPQQQAELDSAMNSQADDVAYLSDVGFVFNSRYRSLSQLDSARAAKKNTKEEMEWMDYARHKKAIELSKYKPDELWDLFLESVGRNFPKTLFVFMPLFAFILWVLHSKQRWLYYDHAVFTLHYFSFLLLAFAGWSITGVGFDWLFTLLKLGDPGYVKMLLLLVLLCWYVYYFFRAHFKFYEEYWLVSLGKGLFIFGINVFLFTMIFFALLIITLYTLH